MCRLIKKADQMDIGRRELIQKDNQFIYLEKDKKIS